MHKEIIILGDIEMGGGTLTDDFISNRALSSLIAEQAAKNHSVDLVLNGDTFDFLKCPILVGKKTSYPRQITREVSLAKLKLIHQAHKPVFQALGKFLKNRNHHLYFTFGNHDLDLVFPEVQSAIRKLLGAKDQIHFEVKYHYGGVYAEHGMQYDFLNKADFKKIFLRHHGQELLNISWISFGLISKFMSMKEEHPFMERIMTRNELFGKYPAIPKKITFQAASYFFKSLVYYPWRYLTDPTYTLPRGLFFEFLRRVKKMHWDVDQVVDVFKRHHRRKLFKSSQNRIYVLSHIHERYFEEKDDRIIIHPGSWRDEYDLVSGKLIPRMKRYVGIKIDSFGHHSRLMEFPVKRSTFDFGAVIKNEKKFLKMAAKEEGFNLK